MASILIVLLVLPAAVSGYYCTNRTDGNYEIGCRSYLICSDGVPAIHDCYRNNTYFEVYNNRTGLCDNPANVMHPCGVVRDCSGEPNGIYPDVEEKCRSFYTCYAGKFLGHNFCPTGLTFDTSKDTCNWVAAVPPPCGTKGVPAP